MGKALGWAFGVSWFLNDDLGLLGRLSYGRVLGDDHGFGGILSFSRAFLDCFYLARFLMGES